MPPSRTSRLLPSPTQVTGTSGRQRAQECREVLDVPRREPGVGGPADVPGRVARHRLVAEHAVPEFRRDGELAHRPALALVTPSLPGSSCATAPMLPAPIVSTTSRSAITPASAAGEFAHVLDEHGLEPPAAAHGAADRAAVGVRDRLLARRVDLGHEQRVRSRERAAEVVDQVVRARVAVRLEGEHQPPARPGLARGLDRRLDLGRMVAVVVDERDAPGLRRDFADDLEPAADALEAGERALDRGVLDLELGRDRDRGERVAHVVQCPAGSARRRAAGGPARIAWKRVVPPSRSSETARRSASSPRP